MSKQEIGAKERALREMREAAMSSSRTKARLALTAVKAAVDAIPVKRRPKAKKTRL